jgi:hypothetical protein
VIVCAPPVRWGTVKIVWKAPAALVVKQVEPPTVASRLSACPVPPFVVVQEPRDNHATVEVPSVLVMASVAPLAKPIPERVRLEPTVVDVTDGVTVGPAACAALYGSRKTIPAIPARRSSPTVPKEASLLFGVICVCILFTYFRNFWVPNYDI